MTGPVFADTNVFVYRHEIRGLDPFESPDRAPAEIPKSSEA